MNWSCVLERNAEKHPERECLISAKKRFTYQQVWERVSSLAQGLKDIGIQKGDIVGILLYNCCEYIEITFAVNQIGGVWLPLNFRLAGEEFQYILQNAGANALIAEKEFVPVISSIKGNLPNLNHYILSGTDVPDGWISYDELIVKNRGAKPAHADVGFDDLHRLMYTSGTTAHPKGAMLTYGNLYWKNFSSILTFNITDSDRTLVVGPLYHVGGMDLPGTVTVHAGGSLVILERFDPVELLKAVDREKVTNMWLSPVMTIMLFNEPTFKQYDFSSVRFIIDGGEKMPLTVIKEFKEKLPNVWYADGYGMTETLAADVMLAKDKMLTKIGSVGKPVPFVQLRIVDDNGRDVGPNELGEICLKGPKVFRGYWKDPESTAEALKDEWFHSGDIGTLDEEGYLYIMDRKKDMIISGGENIASPEVERVIYELPAVLETAVVGIPHPRWLEVPKAYVVLKAGESLTAEEIMQYCTKKMAKFKVPKEIEFINQLPRNPSGKVLKRKLRDMHIAKIQKNKH